MISFTNTGELDFKGAMTFGVSAKETNNPIGQFGTGMKYAVAILLRTGHTVTASSGNKDYVFGLEDLAFRGKQFQTVTMNGSALGFTTHLGDHWQGWQAYRELFCNMLDEPNGQVVEHDKALVGQPNFTSVTVDGPLIHDIHANQDKWFITGRTPELKLGNVGMHFGLPQPGIFLKGVLVKAFTDDVTAGCSYDFPRGLDLTEDRTVKYSFQVSQHLGQELCQSEDPNAIAHMAIFTGTKDTFESQVVPTGRLNETFREIATEVLKNPRAVFHRGVKEWLRGKGMDTMYDTYEPDGLEQAMMVKAIDFLTKLGLWKDFPILYVEDLGDRVLAKAEPTKQRILIAAPLFDHGTRYIASTLLEEVLHLQTGFGDETRELQTRLFDIIIKMGERQLNTPL